MGTLKWYARDPRAALIGMMGLTLEERGAYNTILDLIYVHDGEVIDDETYLLAWLRVEKRIWRRIRTRLLSLGKLYVREGCLRSERADDEVRKAKLRYLSSVKGNDKRWATYREIKGLRDPVGLLSTPTISKYLSAKIVPIAPHKTPEKKK